MKREFLQGLLVGDMPLSKEVIDTIMAENGRDIESIKARYGENGVQILPHLDGLEGFFIARLKRV